jgi:hypothetical protein
MFLAFLNEFEQTSSILYSLLNSIKIIKSPDYLDKNELIKLIEITKNCKFLFSCDNLIINIKYLNFSINIEQYISINDFFYPLTKEPKFKSFETVSKDFVKKLIFLWEENETIKKSDAFNLINILKYKLDDYYNELNIKDILK